MWKYWEIEREIEKKRRHIEKKWKREIEKNKERDFNIENFERNNTKTINDSSQF